MVAQLNKELLFSTFNVEDFKTLEEILNNMSPSIVEYYLSDLGSDCGETYFNKRDIQNYIDIGEYSIYMDYSENIFLEILNNSEDDYETSSLW